KIPGELTQGLNFRVPEVVTFRHPDVRARTRTSPSSADSGGGRDRYGRAGLGPADFRAASRAGVSAGAARAGASAGVRAGLGVAAAGELRRDPVRGAALADPGDERAAPAGAHPPARALLAG